MSRLSALALALLAALRPAHAQEPQRVSGTLDAKTIWRGTILLEGDVEVPSGGMLEVERGTRILVAGEDKTSSGLDKRQVELKVLGGVQMIGSADHPIVIEPAPGAAAHDDGEGHSIAWHGITLWPYEGKASPSRLLSGLVIRGAMSAIQVPQGEAQIARSVFAGCSTGVEVGSGWATARDKGTKEGLARPSISECRFASCYAGVYAEGLGAPQITRCVFHDCAIGAGNRRIGISFVLRRPGFGIDRCDFLENRIGVHGPGVVANSIFSRNQAALVLSDFHATFSVQIDLVNHEHNLFHENTTVITGDACADPLSVEGDPGFVGKLALTSDGPPIPKQLELRPDSIARGRATDGGDLGATGGLGAKVAPVAWIPKGSRLPGMLALEMPPPKPDAKGKVPPAKPPSAGPEPGAEASGSWWAAWPCGADCIYALRAADAAADLWCAFRVEAKDDCKLKLELNADVERLEGTWNGRPAFTVASPRRFDHHGLVVSVDARKGKNLLMLRLRPLGTDARLGVGCEGSAPDMFSVPAPRLLAPLTIANALVRKDKTARFLEITTSQPLNWIDRDKASLVRLLSSESREIPLDAPLPFRVVAPKKLRLGPLPDSVAAPFLVRFAGAVGADGSAADDAPVQARNEAK